jgi:hypothetical protein
MASKKYVDGQDGTPGEYHPLVYARYWRMAADAMVAANDEGEVYFAQFEKLIANPDDEARRIAGFLDARFEGTVERTQGNTSFKGGKRRSITPTEAWVCERIAGDSMKQLGYDPSEGKLRLQDAPDLAWRSLRFTAAQGKRIVKDPAARQSVKFFLRSLVSKSTGDEAPAQS